MRQLGRGPAFDAGLKLTLTWGHRVVIGRKPLGGGIKCSRFKQMKGKQEWNGVRGEVEGKAVYLPPRQGWVWYHEKQ